MRKLETVEYDLYKKAHGVSRSILNVAIVTEFGLTRTKYKIKERKLIEYHRIEQMEVKRFIQYVTVKAEKMGRKKMYAQKEKR